MHRDPDTGKFVSGDDRGGAGLSWNETQALTGTVQYRIPAADLSGQTTERTVASDEARLVDFDDALAEDQVFEAIYIAFGATFSMSVTSSGEMHGAVFYQLSDEPLPQGNRPPTWGTGSTQVSGGDDGILDISHSSEENDKAIWTSRLIADNGESDDTNSIGRGALEAWESHLLPLKSLVGGGPLYDADDELYAPCEIYTDLVANVGVNFEVSATIRGIVHET